MGDVESGAMMTVNFKTMPYSNNKYHFSEPYLVYDMHADITHEGKVTTVNLINAEDTLKTKPVFIPWHWKKENNKFYQILFKHWIKNT